MIVLLFIPLIIGIAAPIFRLLIVFGNRKPGERPVKYTNFAGQVADISTVVIVPVLGFTFLGIISDTLPASYVWSALVVTVMINYFLALGLEFIRSPEEELLLNGLLAAGVITNLLMGFVWGEDYWLLLVTGPIAVQLLYAMVKRDHYLNFQLDSAGEINKYGVEDILDHVVTRSEGAPTIQPKTSLGSQLIGLLEQPALTRFVIYGLVGLTIFAGFLALATLIGGSWEDAYGFFVLGPDSL